MMDAPFPTHYQWEKKKLLEAQVFFFPKSPSNLILLDFWRCLFFQRPCIGSIGKWVLANTGQWKSVLLKGACQAHPPDSKHLSSDYLIIPGLYNYQPAFQCMTMLYNTFWVSKSGMKQTEGKWHIQFFYWEGAGLLRLFFLLILLTVLFRDCRFSLAFMLTSLHPTNSAEWRKIPFFLLATFHLKRTWVLDCCYGTVLLFVWFLFPFALWDFFFFFFLPVLGVVTLSSKKIQLEFKAQNMFLFIPAEEHT